MGMLETVERVPIDLPHAGETFNDATAALFLERLVMLRGLGYKFQDDLLDAVQEEVDEENNHQNS